MKCWEGYERVPGTKTGTKGSCRKKSPKKASPKKRKSPKKTSPKKKSPKKKKSPNRKSPKKSSPKPCSPGKNHKFAKVVQGHCVRFGDPNMTIKKNIPARKRSFCARHRCSEKHDPTTPGYQSCKKWNC